MMVVILTPVDGIIRWLPRGFSCSRLKTSIKTITYLSDIGCLEIQGASLITSSTVHLKWLIKS